MEPPTLTDRTGTDGANWAASYTRVTPTRRATSYPTRTCHPHLGLFPNPTKVGILGCLWEPRLNSINCKRHLQRLMFIRCGSEVIKYLNLRMSNANIRMFSFFPHGYETKFCCSLHIPHFL